MVNLTNISSETVKGVWYDKPYELAAGASAEFDDGMAVDLRAAHPGAFAPEEADAPVEETEQPEEADEAPEQPKARKSRKSRKSTITPEA